MSGDRRSAWFPLALLGFLLLGAAAWDLTEHSAWFAYAPIGDDPLVQTRYAYAPYQPEPVWEWGTPWQVVVALAFLGALGWFAARDRLPPLRIALVLGAGTAVILLSTAVTALAKATDAQFPTTALGAPLAVLGAVAGVWAGFRLGPGRRVATAACLVCLTLAAYLFGASAEAVDPVTAALGLGVLAWYTRSKVPAVAAAAVLVTAIAFSSGTLGLLVPGALVLAAALAVLRPA
ncbi:hypothetical protein [Amycolatopsis dongchuanensis]|uniref:hypothetical protein n=1 Tax=Amycolatopsis dongchuanensis TaxID=1070866 RepID=UPI0031F7DB8C